MVQASSDDCSFAVITIDGTVKSSTYGAYDWKNVVDISVSHNHIMGFHANGYVFTDKYKNEAFGKVGVISAFETGDYMAYLRSDGTVDWLSKRFGETPSWLHDLQYWKGIVAISGGSHHIVGLKANGTVICEYDDIDECGCYDLSGWTDIKIPKR